MMPGIVEAITENVRETLTEGYTDKAQEGSGARSWCVTIVTTLLLDFRLGEVTHFNMIEITANSVSCYLQPKVSQLIEVGAI